MPGNHKVFFKKNGGDTPKVERKEKRKKEGKVGGFCEPAREWTRRLNNAPHNIKYSLEIKILLQYVVFSEHLHVIIRYSYLQSTNEVGVNSVCN